MRRRRKQRKSYIGWLWKTKQRHCHYCGRMTVLTGGPRQLTADHVRALSKGGYDKRKNVAPACSACNSAKGSSTAGEFVASGFRPKRVSAIIGS